MAKSFDQYMAETGQQSTLNELRQTYKYDEAKSKYDSTGSYNQNSSSSSTGTDFDSTLQRALELQKEASAPAISSLQSSIPEIQSSYASQKEYAKSQISSLEDRYQNLLDTIKTNQTAAETTATKTASQELGRRGIVGSSGVADTALQEAVSPITSEYSNLLSSTGIAQEADIAAANQNLTQLSANETAAIREVNNAIAQLQSATTSDAVTQALNQLQIAQSQLSLEQSQNQFNAQQEQSQNQFDAQQALANEIYKNISLPESKYNVNKPYSTDTDTSYGASNWLSNTSGYSVGSNVLKLIAAGKVDEAIELLYNP